MEAGELMTTLSNAAGPAGRRPGQCPTSTVSERVALLLQEMTLEEKVAQLGSRWLGNDMPAENAPAQPPTTAEDLTTTDDLTTDGDPKSADDQTFNVAPMADVFAASGMVGLEEASA